LRSVLGLEDAEWIIGAAERFLKEVSEYLKKPS
jgi:hypothetical protein